MSVVFLCSFSLVCVGAILAFHRRLREFDSFRHANAQLSGELAEHRLALTEQKMRKEAAFSEVTSLKTVIKRITAERNDMETELRDELAKSMSMCARHEDKCGTLLLELDHQRQEYASKSAGLLRDIQGLQTERSDLQQQFQRLELELHQMTQRFANSEQRLRVVDAERSTCREWGAALTDSNQVLQAEVEHLQSQINAMNEVNEGLIAERNHLQGRLRTAGEAVEQQCAEKMMLAAAKVQLQTRVDHMDTTNGRLRITVTELRSRVLALETAITNHRNARGHQRCLTNDHDLYRVYDPNLQPINPAGNESLPELMAGCTAYWLGQLGLKDKVPEKMEISKKDVMS